MLLILNSSAKKSFEGKYKIQAKFYIILTLDQLVKYLVYFYVYGFKTGTMTFTWLPLFTFVLETMLLLL